MVKKQAHKLPWGVYYYKDSEFEISCIDYHKMLRSIGLKSLINKDTKQYEYLVESNGEAVVFRMNQVIEPEEAINEYRKSLI